MADCRSEPDICTPWGGRLPDPNAVLVRRTEPGEALKFLNDVVLSYQGDSCLTWPFWTGKQGYAQVNLGKRFARVHRLACEAEHGPAPSGKPYALHSCGNGHRGCVARKHLRWGSPRENHLDSVAHGTWFKPPGRPSKGSKNPFAKLNEEIVRQIKAEKGREIGRVVAAKYGVDGSTVTRIWSGKTWGHV